MVATIHSHAAMAAIVIHLAKGNSIGKSLSLWKTSEWHQDQDQGNRAEGNRAEGNRADGLTGFSVIPGLQKITALGPTRTCTCTV